MNIDWQPPPPRDGFDGALDRFVGPGATRAELVVQFVLGGLVGLLALAAFLATRNGDTPWYALVVLGIVAVDMGGGIATNATGAAKRWYHRAGQGRLQHLLFVAAHGAHLAVFAVIFVPDPWSWFGLAYAGLLAGALAVVLSPLYLQRPVALSLVAVAIVGSGVAPLAVDGLTWFLPLLALKLWVAHLLKEAPFRP